MTEINVVLDLPEQFIEGLQNGSLEQIGGVIRKTDGKRVVAWLRETSTDLRNSDPGSLHQESGLPDIIANHQLLMGIQVVNLAVSAVGFALIYHKIEKVDQVLRNVDCKLDQMASELKWGGAKEHLHRLAPMIAATKTVKEIHGFKDDAIANQKLVNADDHFEVAKVYFRSIIGKMMANVLEYERPVEFAACYRAWVMANLGAINTMVALQKIPVALERAEQLKVDHASIGKGFVEHRSNDVMRSLRRRAQADSKVFDADTYLNDLSHQMAGAHGLIKGQVLQLDFANHKGVSLNEIDRQLKLNSGSSKYVVCLVDEL